MKILKYKKYGKNRYKVILEDNEEIVLYEDIILKYNLLLTKEIDNIDDILNDNNKYELYDKVLSYINKRIRCESEIRSYLKKYTSDSNIINNIVDKLYKNKLINDSLYIKSYIHDKINFTNDGPIKIKNDLLKLGFDNYNIEDNLVEFNDKLQKEKIDNYISKYLKSNNKSLYSFKQKMLLNLISLGYEKELIVSRLNKVYFNDNESLEKDKEKIRKKYSKKYSGYELDNIIKRKLYEKGYRDFD